MQKPVILVLFDDQSYNTESKLMLKLPARNDLTISPEISYDTILRAVVQRLLKPNLNYRLKKEGRGEKNIRNR